MTFSDVKYKLFFRVQMNKKLNVVEKLVGKI